MNRQDLNAAYDGPIPAGLMAAVENAEAILRNAARCTHEALPVSEQVRLQIEAQHGAITLTWSDVRRLCRRRDGLLPSLLEAKTKREEAYHSRRYEVLRVEVHRLLRRLSEQKGRLANLESIHRDVSREAA